MTAAHRSLVALALLGASIVHLAVAASGVAPLAAALLGVVGVAEAVGAALVLRGALAADPGLLVALVVAPVILLSGALTLADALERPDLVAAFATPALLGSAVLAFAGAAVAGHAARRLRVADAPRAVPARPGRPARQAVLLVSALIATGAVAAPAVASVRPELVPGSAMTTLVDERGAGEQQAPQEAQQQPEPRFAAPGHEGHHGMTP